MANKFWVGGTGTWDGGTLDSGFWKTATGGSTTTTAPTSADVAIFDNLSGGGTVTVVGNMTVSGFTISSHTGTVDFASSNITCNSTTTVGATGVHTVKFGSGVHTLKANFAVSQSGTNLTLDVGTATLNFEPTGQGLWTMAAGMVNAHRVRMTGLPLAGSFAQFAAGGGTFSINYLEINNSNGLPIVLAINASTMNVNNSFHLAGHPRAPIYFRGVSGGGIMTIAAGQYGFIDWFYSYGMTFGSGITLRNGYDGKGNATAIIPPQATAIGAL
jgi:hypothetical protein